MTTPSPATDKTKPGPLAEGEMVAGRYRIAAVLGEGGMGVVYRAEHVHMRKPVALKVLHREVSDHAEIVARFEREAVAAANIEHPNVVAATDFGRLEDGSFFLVLEYIAGRSLRAELAKGAMDPARALRILRGIAAGVGAAHDKGIVHRDLKPENVMLVERDGDPDFPKVLDFGIAKVETAAAAPASGVQALTRIGMIYGTPDYMAPEQALGEPVDARADFFALGIMLFELLTGKPPWSGGAVTQLRERLLAEAPPELPDDSRIEPSLRAIVRKLLAREKEARFQTAAELLRAIDEKHAEVDALVNAATVPPPNMPTAGLPVAEPRPRASGPSKSVLYGAAGGGVGLLVVLVLAIALSGGKPKEDPIALGTTRGATLGAELGDAMAAEAAQVKAEEEAKAAAAAAAAASAAPANGDAPPGTSGGSPSTSRRGTRREQPKGQGRREGPGGIYIPPPKDWFK